MRGSATGSDDTDTKVAERNCASSSNKTERTERCRRRIRFLPTRTTRGSRRQLLQCTPTQELWIYGSRIRGGKRSECRRRGIRVKGRSRRHLQRSRQGSRCQLGSLLGLLLLRLLLLFGLAARLTCQLFTPKLTILQVMRLLEPFTPTMGATTTIRFQWLSLELTSFQLSWPFLHRLIYFKFFSCQQVLFYR